MKLKRIIVSAIAVLATMYLVTSLATSRFLAKSAVDSLSDMKILRETSAISIDLSQTRTSDACVEELQRSLPANHTGKTALVYADVRWNAIVCARVVSGQSNAAGHERRDAIYLNVFGVWITLHRIQHSIGCT
ncbi:MAG: hypothetical protein QM811_25095 [Pirellulales bacterium]